VARKKGAGFLSVLLRRRWPDVERGEQVVKQRGVSDAGLREGKETERQRAGDAKRVQYRTSVLRGKRLSGKRLHALKQMLGLRGLDAIFNNALLVNVHVAFHANRVAKLNSE